MKERHSFERTGGHTSDQRSQVHKLINAFTHTSKCLEDPQKGPQGTQLVVKVLISFVVLAAIQLEKCTDSINVFQLIRGISFNLVVGVFVGKIYR